MGIVAKQSVWNSIILFVGVIVGALNTMLLFPVFLSKEEFGLTRILIAVAMLTTQVAMVGTPSIYVRYLPGYRKEKGNSGGLINWTLKLSIVGFLIVGACLFLFKSWILLPYQDSAKLFSEYYFQLFPLMFFLIGQALLKAYCRGVFKTIYEMFVNEVLLRLLQTTVLLLYAFKIVDYPSFVTLFVFSNGISMLLVLVYLLAIKEFDLKSNPALKQKKVGKELLQYGGANFLTGIAYSLANRIDVLMLGAYVSSALTGNAGLEAAAIYVFASYIVSLIEMPARATNTIAVPLVAKAWYDKDMVSINSIYKKTSINQLLFGTLIFLGIWINLDDMIGLIKEFPPKFNDYSEAKWVVFYLGLAKLFHVASGVNGGIIVTSSRYLFGTYLSLGLAVLTFITNLIMIPLLGIVGAAIATSFSIFLFNFIAFLFLKVNYNLQPHSYKSLIVIVLGLLVYVVAEQFIQIDQPIINILVRSVVMVVLYIPLIVVFKISEDVNVLINRALGKRK